MALRKWGSETLVNTQTTDSQFGSSVSVFDDGSYAIEWTTNDPAGDGSFASVKMQRYSAAGIKLGSETLVNTTFANSQSNAKSTVLNDGSLLVTWTDGSNALGNGSDVRFRRFDSNGTPIDASDVALSLPGVEESPAATALQSGGFALAYMDFNSGSARDIALSIFAAGGTVPTATVTVAATANQENEANVTQLADGTLAVTWVDLDADLSRMQLVNGTTGALIGSTINVGANTSPQGPDVTVLAGGGFVVTWQTNNPPAPDVSLGVRARVYQPGNPPTGGAEFAVATDLNEAQARPAIASLSDGGFVVVYESGATGASRTVAQLFNANGSKRGGEYILDTDSSSVDVAADVAVMSDGRIIVTWQSGFDIFSQIIDPRDGLVNGTTAGETLYGNDVYADEINGFGGADTLFGLAGNDALFGGDGNDLLYGGRGDDTVFGGINDDNLYGDLGDDEQYGEGGNDIIWSGGGSDLMDGGAGTGDAAFYTNELTGAIVNLTDQTLNAGSALGDTLFNFERVFGSVRGANDLTGDASANILVGGQVSDIMRGGAGADVLRGGIGVDTMAGGLNNDIFQYLAPNEGGDVLNDFAAGDKFQFVRTAFGNLAGANVAAANFLSLASGNAATNASQRFIFDESTKKLFYDADGNGATAATLIADLSTSYNILNTDLLLA